MSDTRIVVPIMAPTPKAMAALVEKALGAGAEAIELRVDALTSLAGRAVETLAAQTRQKAGPSRPVVVTCRDHREGGVLDHPLAARIEAWVSAIRAGSDYIDVELENFRLVQVSRPVREALAQAPQARLILSSHSMTGPFAGLQWRYDQTVAAYPAAVPKLIYTANHINDCFDALDLLRRARQDTITFCMGPAGWITRLLAKKLGGLFTYGSLESAAATAPGQIPIDQMKGLYRSDAIDGDTEFFGLIGDPVGHSMGPVVHNACFGQLNMNRVYLPLWVAGGPEELFAFLDAVRARAWLDFRGFSVTLPHKTSVLEYARVNGGTVEGLAARIGAVNTLLLDRQGGIKAFNTDYVGAMEAILSTLKIGRGDLKGRPVAVVGAGGVARAIVAGLCDAGARVTIYNRTVSKARALAGEFGCTHAALDELANVKAGLLVNCTNMGMHPEVDATPVPAEVLRPDMAVFDTVYNPAQTQLLRLAAQKGATCIDGVAMFVNQARAQFRLFTGEEADTALMRQVVARGLEGA